MALEMTTAGILVKYAVEQTAGTRPTSNYTEIPDIKSIPDLNVSPEQIEVTNLKDTTYKRYIPGLKDVGDALAFNANFTKEFMSAWKTMVTASETAKAAGKATWYQVFFPGLDEDFYFAGIPTPLGMPAAEPNNVLEVTGYITVNQVADWVERD